MTPVIPSSINNVLLISGTPFPTRKTVCIKRCNLVRNSTRQTLLSQTYVLPLSKSVRLFPQFRSGFSLHHESRIHKISATGTDIAVEEAGSPFADEDSGGDLESPSDAVGTSEESSVKSDSNVTPAQRKRSRPARKSEMPPVKPEELVPGATFTGKIRSIQPFGAFVDFGAFTDGLVHVSRLSDSFVTDVGNVVSIGQEVKVRLVEANVETGRISLTMRESDDISKLQQRRDGPASSDTGRPPRKSTPRSNQRRDEVKKTSKFVKGQDLEGTVKNLTRSGSFISLPEGEEGFLPASEELDEGFGNIMGGSSLQVGQEVSVRVLRITRGQVTLTMKKEEDVGELDLKLSQGVVHAATNPFMLAFRKNKDIAEFLDEREKEAEAAEASEIPQTSDEMKGKVTQTETELVEVQDQQASGSGELDAAVSVIDETVEDDETSTEEAGVESSIVEDASNDIASDKKDRESMASDSSEGVDGVVQIIKEEEEVRSEILAPEESDTSDQLAEDAPAVDGVKNDGESDLPGQTADQEEVRSEILAPEESDTVDQLAEDAPAVDGVKNDGESDLPGQTANLEEVRSEILAPEQSDTSDQLAGDAPAVDGVKNDGKSDLLGQTAEQISSEIQVSKEVTQIANNNQSPENMVADSLQSVDSVAGCTEEKLEASPEMLSPERGASATEVSTTDRFENVGKSDLSGQISDPIMSESAISKEATESQIDVSIEKDEVMIPSPKAGNETLSATRVDDEKVGINPDKNGSINSSNEQIDVTTAQQSTTEESQVTEEVENEIDDTKAKGDLENGTTADNGTPTAPVEDEKVESVPEKNGSITNSNGQSSAASPSESTIKAAISPALVKQLREETGAGMMDCKKALSETGGNLVKAQEFLRKKGLASADKKASRVTAEGRIGSYIHDSRIGVLIEVNCETDFVSRGDIFKDLVDDLAMQVAACPQVQYLVTEDVPKEIVDKEREIEMQKEDLLSKPEQIRSKIVEGRIRKRLEELALLEQSYIKNDKLVVKDWVKQTIATIGENMKVQRFVRFNLGEGLERKSQDFAAEVAAQTAAKPVPSPGKEQPAAVEAKETVDKPVKATVSAALVKQLREETGAGMMDCKKALSETGGDLEKAQEYLRKKGLSTADKKSGRLAAEGRIGSYIHDSRIGVLIEVNCETDFVGRSEKFKELVDDLAMQVVACPQVQHVSVDEIPQSIVSKEKELEMQREDLQSKPESIRERIVEGRVSKRLGELALLEQPFIKNDSILVKDLVKQTVAALGENIKVRRFVRFTLGETNESVGTENAA